MSESDADGMWVSLAAVVISSAPLTPETGFSHKSWISVLPLQSRVEEMCSSQQLFFQSGRGRQTELRAKADATAPPAGSRPDQVCLWVWISQKWSWYWEVFLPQVHHYYIKKDSYAKGNTKKNFAGLFLFWVQPWLSAVEDVDCKVTWC